MRVLMIEDDRGLAAMVREYLASNGLDVTVCHDAASGLATLERGGFDALILDVMLPDRDGFDICRTVRAHSPIPILMLTARGDETDRIVGLELGADDYLPKPFNPRELLARLRAIFRRAGGGATGGGAAAGIASGGVADDASTLRFGRLEIDRAARVVRVDGAERPLTAYQFDLLCALADNAGRVMTRDMLMNRVRGDSHEAFDRSIDVHVSRIRSAIEEDPARPRRILTIRGTGYVFARRQDDEGA